ncbi:Uncharacterised protein [Enterobacter cloacae]|nr:Uncharacterised protein [Enterobacter cloacae]
MIFLRLRRQLKFAEHHSALVIDGTPDGQPGVRPDAVMQRVYRLADVIVVNQTSDQLHGRCTGLHTLQPGFRPVLHFGGEHFRPVATLCQRVHGLGRNIAAVQRGQHHAGVVIPAARRRHVSM